MAIVSIEEFMAYGRDSFASVNEPEAQFALDAAEEAVNDHCGRQFVVASGSSLRKFRPNGECSTALWIDDCTTVTTVTDDGSTITNYQLEPLNGRTSSGRQVPYDCLRRLDGTWSWSWDGEALVSVTANWGWSAIPSAVKQATLIIAKDVYQQRNTTSGLVGIGDFGPVTPRYNRVAMKLLDPYRRAESFGVG